MELGGRAETQQQTLQLNLPCKKKHKQLSSVYIILEFLKKNTYAGNELGSRAER